MYYTGVVVFCISGVSCLPGIVSLASSTDIFRACTHNRGTTIALLVMIYGHPVFSHQLHKIREAREAVDARFAENALQLMERQAEKQTSATRRQVWMERLLHAAGYGIFAYSTLLWHSYLHIVTCACHV